ncbi:hypothetical protein ACFKHW_29920 [Bradyrhizobium lupini]|uniref:hypothetical protein n=1 Tax=Rhizobium lupini TaxID=136996 RepID=UPI003671DDA1
MATFSTAAWSVTSGAGLDPFDRFVDGLMTYLARHQVLQTRGLYYRARTIAAALHASSANWLLGIECLDLIFVVVSEQVLTSGTTSGRDVPRQAKGYSSSGALRQSRAMICLATAVIQNSARYGGNLIR